MGQQVAEALPSCPLGGQVGLAVVALLGALHGRVSFSKYAAYAAITCIHISVQVQKPPCCLNRRCKMLNLPILSLP